MGKLAPSQTFFWRSRCVRKKVVKGREGGVGGRSGDELLLLAGNQGGGGGLLLLPNPKFMKKAHQLCTSTSTEGRYMQFAGDKYGTSRNNNSTSPLWQKLVSAKIHWSYLLQQRCPWKIRCGLLRLLQSEYGGKLCSRPNVLSLENSIWAT
jgi:hypothetical protein